MRIEGHLKTIQYQGANNVISIGGNTVPLIELILQHDVVNMVMDITIKRELKDIIIPTKGIEHETDVNIIIGELHKYLGLWCIVELT